MTERVREHGVLEPVLVWLKHEPESDTDKFIILSGHNRVNASKFAGLDKVPVWIMENLTENEAALIVTETGKRVTEHQAKQLREQADALDEASIREILCGGTSEDSKPYSLKVPHSVIARYFSEKTKKKDIAATVEKALAMYFAGKTEVI